MSEIVVLPKSEFGDFITEAYARGYERARDDFYKPAREVMTTEQLAEFWECSVKHIQNLAKRGENPLPSHSIGDLPRFYLSEVSQWSKAEALRKGKLK